MEKIDGTADSFFGFAQLFSDKTERTLKSTALVANPVNDILLNVSVK